MGATCDDELPFEGVARSPEFPGCKSHGAGTFLESTFLATPAKLLFSDRGAPQFPQNCSASISLPPHFQQAESATAVMEAGLGAAGFGPSSLSSPAAAFCPSAKAARLGASCSIAAIIEERSSATDFFNDDSEARPIASVTSPAMSWQV